MKLEKLKIALSSSGIEIEVLSETNAGPYLVRKEAWTCNGDTTETVQAYTHDGQYLGDVATAKRLWDKYGIVPETSSLGYSARDEKWYGWSHRAIYGFKPGDSVAEGHCAYTPEKGAWTAVTEDDAKQMAIDFAESVSSDCLVSVSSSPVVPSQRFGL